MQVSAPRRAMFIDAAISSKWRVEDDRLFRVQVNIVHQLRRESTVVSVAVVVFVRQFVCAHVDRWVQVNIVHQLRRESNVVNVAVKVFVGEVVSAHVDHRLVLRSISCVRRCLARSPPSRTPPSTDDDCKNDNNNCDHDNDR